jgi:hypothetical protein
VTPAVQSANGRALSLKTRRQNRSARNFPATFRVAVLQQLAGC